MERFTALSRGTQVMLIAGVLLLIDTFLKWQEVSVSVAGVEVASASQNAWHGFWGVVMGLLLILLLAWIAARLAGVDMSLPVSETLIVAALAALIFLFALIKNLADDYSTFWSYVGVVLAALIAVGAWLEVQAAGGVDTLRSEMSTMTSSSTSSSGRTEPTPPPAEPPATPPATPPSTPPSENP